MLSRIHYKLCNTVHFLESQNQLPSQQPHLHPRRVRRKEYWGRRKAYLIGTMKTGLLLMNWRQWQRLTRNRLIRTRLACGLRPLRVMPTPSHTVRQNHEYVLGPALWPVLYAYVLSTDFSSALYKVLALWVWTSPSLEWSMCMEYQSMQTS